MPCNSDYLEPTNHEICQSQVACLLDELDGKKWTLHEWNGGHPRVYNKPDKKTLDKMTANLCARLKRIKDVTKYSLEMQMWWRDHQEADRLRKEKEAAEELKGLRGQLLVMYFDADDMKWYFGGLDHRKGFCWCEDMRHSTLFNEDQVKNIRKWMVEQDMEEVDFQVFEKRK